MHVLHRCGARFIVKHVEHFTKILWRSRRTTVTNQEKHHTVRVVFSLYVFIHPYLPQYIHRFHTETLPHAMSQSGSSGNVTDTHDFANMRHIVPRFKRLHLTRTFTSPWHVGASVHSIHSGLSVHRPVCPRLCFCDAGNGDNCTSSIRAVEVETSAYLRCGS
ncbi:AC5 [Tomato leaf curl New Delhi virus 5]|uniref:AC5 n=1 Tax=Tomato leaf curl New Delhi virus 5 TaxID=2560812 RepID=A4L728_9GEMI|nr:AC5 [Tomato leaf curl New Delhi virus 5]ABO40823.1 AC5 [Tomato leaf curl New Delhi virus 5]